MRTAPRDRPIRGIWRACAARGHRLRGGLPDPRGLTAYAGGVDLGAVKAAAAPVLVNCAVGAAANAQGLLDDAESLCADGRHARAYALAALAVEEAGKAASMSTVAMMPVRLRAQAP